MRAFIRLLDAGFKEFVRDRMAMFWTVAFPIMFILVFGVFFANNDTGAYAIGLVLEDEHDQAALGFFCMFEMVDRESEGEPAISPEDAQLCAPWFQEMQAAGPPADAPADKLPLYIHRGTLDAELAKLKKGDRRAVVVFPAGFGEQVEAGLGEGGVAANVIVHYDASQTTTAQIVRSILSNLLDAYDRQLSGSAPVIQVDFQSITAERLRFIDFFVPGIVAVSLMQLGLFGSVEMVGLRERNILKRLGATPLSRRTLVLSQVTLRLGIAVLQTAIILFVGWWVFDVQIGERVPLLVMLVLLGGLTFTAIGYLVASFARTEAAGNAIVMAIQFPMMFLAGVYWPVDFAPEWLQPVIKAIPLTYLGDALRQAMVPGASQLFPLTIDLVVLTAWLLVSLFVAFRFFRWE